MTARPRIAVHKFSSCDGCQLAFLNAGEDLLTLDGLVDIVHFAEAGPVDETAQVDIAFVEGSISTQADAERIRRVRERAGFLVTLGAAPRPADCRRCATWPTAPGGWPVSTPPPGMSTVSIPPRRSANTCASISSSGAAR